MKIKEGQGCDLCGAPATIVGGHYVTRPSAPQWWRSIKRRMSRKTYLCEDHAPATIAQVIELF